MQNPLVGAGGTAVYAADVKNVSFPVFKECSLCKSAVRLQNGFYLIQVVSVRKGFQRRQVPQEYVGRFYLWTPVFQIVDDCPVDSGKEG